MELGRRHGLVWALAAVGFVALLLLLRLQSFGIWDPWELEPADEARHLLAGEGVDGGRPILPTLLVALGFASFGVREWAGRIPMALMGIAAVVLAYFLVRRFAGRRAGAYAALIAGTTPLFLFNARQMLGDAPAFAAQALIGLAACAAVLPRVPEPDDAREAANERRRFVQVGIWLGVTLVGVVLATLATGALMGALPPLLAVAIVGCMDRLPLEPKRDLPRAVGVYAIVALTAIVAFFVTGAVIADHAEYSAWLGGRPRGGDPPTFEVSVEAVFHSFAPWSALLPIAIGRMLVPRVAPAAPDVSNGGGDATASADALRRVLLLWAAFGYGALVIFESRYGPGTYIPVVALAGAVALLLRDVEESGEAWWAAGVVAALAAGLLIRDFGLYPGGPIGGLGIEDVTVPEVFNPKTVWSIVLGLFAAMAVLTFAAVPVDKPDLRAPYRLLRAQWERRGAFRAWIVAGGLFVLFLLVFGVITLVAGQAIGLTTLVIKWGRRLMLVPFAVPVVIALGQIVMYLLGRLGPYRLLPLLIAGAVVGAWAAQGYLPMLSSHFSPREVYDSYNSLAEGSEPLAEYRVGGRAAAYYARGEVRDLESQGELINFLAADERRWAAFPTDELATIDRAFRQRTGRHLFVADARSARVVLATNQPIEGRENESFVAQFVREEAPPTENPVGAVFDNKIELVGYDLELPHDGYVGAGESFTITWYWKALTAVGGSWKVFVHIDGQGQRLNGDHDPVDGKYPVRLWDEGDVIVDRQELTVPANYRPGPYTIFIGLYSGDSRLEIVSGPEAEDDRVRAGVLRIR